MVHRLNLGLDPKHIEDLRPRDLYVVLTVAADIKNLQKRKRLIY